MQNKKYPSVLDSYKLSLSIVGNYKKEFKQSLLYFTLSFVAQGLAFGMFYPFLKSLFAQEVQIPEVWLYFALMVLFSFFSFFFKWKGHDFDYAGNIVEVTNDLRTDLGDTLRSIPLEKLHTYKTGELNNIFSSDVEQSVIHIGMVAAIFLQIVVVPITIVLVTFFMDWRLALVMLALYPLAIPLYTWKRKLADANRREASEAHAELESDLVEYIQGLSVLRAINKTGVNAQKLQASIEEVKKVQEDGIRAEQIPSVLMGVLIQIMLLVLVYIGGVFVLQDTLALVTLGASIVIVSRLTEPLSLFLAVASLIDLMNASFSNIKELLDIEPLKVIKPTKTPSEYSIEFNGVNFTYAGQKEKTIKDMSFSMNSKSMTALVGHSGCGKTTLIKLIMRYADVQSGTVTIGKIDIKKMEQKELMQLISVVFQDVYLFDDTILNNIKMADPNVSDKEVENAAKAAYCHEFIERLPDGYDTRVGDIGGSLSGGERQRISIARAMLKNTPIVILDEPTAALDTESEVAVQKAIDKLIENKTVIVIAHRLSTIAAADKILVIDNGVLIESGSHNGLVEQKGKYYNMWSAQQRIKAWSLDEE